MSDPLDDPATIDLVERLNERAEHAERQRDKLAEALRGAVIVALAAVSAYEAKALKRDCFGKTRLADFHAGIDKARAALAELEKP